MPEAHQLIVQLCNGHPLTLSYILNRLRDLGGENPEDVLAKAPAYSGDVAAEYLAVWEDVCEEDGVVDILAVCSRLRTAFTTQWLRSWAPIPAVRTFQKKLLYLFRHYHDGWRFFHDSFRQFAADQTALGDDGRPDENADSEAYERIADLCSHSTDPRIAEEQLYHRYYAGQHDQVLNLATQATFRKQYLQMRSPDLIGEDVALALDVAANRADVLTILRLLLALAELNDRNVALESVDMPGLLSDAGLIDEAIAYCATGGRSQQLVHAYNLAARLGYCDEYSGRRIFEQIPFDDPDWAQINDNDGDIAVAWVRAAAIFRPLRSVIVTIRNLLDKPLESNRQDRFIRRERWSRYGRMMQVLIDSVAIREGESALVTIDAALIEHTTSLMGKDRTQAKEMGYAERGDDSSEVAIVIDLRVQLQEAILKLSRSADLVQHSLDMLVSISRKIPVYASTALDAAELLAEQGIVDHATRLLDYASYHKVLTVGELTRSSIDNELGLRFRHWRLRHLLASNGEDIPASIPPALDTPAGNDIPKGAPTHSDFLSIKLAADIDSAVRRLGQLAAAARAGETTSIVDVWSSLSGSLDLFQSTEMRNSPTLSLISKCKTELMSIIAEVALEYDQGLPAETEPRARSPVQRTT